MVLSKQEIIKRIQAKELDFKPMLDGFQLQPHAIDLRLGFTFHIPRTWKMTAKGRKAITIDPLAANMDEDNFDKIVLKPGQYFELLPEEYVIATTLEEVYLNAKDTMGVLFPRSSVNRRGLAVDMSGIIDVGYNGFLMIPLKNNTQKQTIRVYPGERVCQVVFQKITNNIDTEEAMLHGLNKAKYHGNKQGFIAGRSDRNDEVSLIKDGEIKKLKQKFALELKKV